jgi:hypothetical protein
MSRTAHNKYEWTIDEINFIKRNFYSMTNQQLADHLGLKLTHLRTKCYELGLKRMELQYWTGEQIQFLKDNYKKIGDTELAEMFSDRWEKPKGWTKKHIEKKRRYLKLKRNPEEQKAIFQRNKKQGAWALCPVHAWRTMGVSEVGTIKVWKTDNGSGRAYIKNKKNHYTPYARWLWKKEKGSIPKGMVVRIINEKVIPGVEDLKLITRAENAKLNKTGFDRLPENLKKVIKLKNKILKEL